MIWESWATIAIFIINLVFLLVMTFVSPFFKKLMAKGVGLVFNVTWLLTITISSAIVMFYSFKCVLGGSKDDNSCKIFAMSVVVLLTLLTILNMSWSIYNTIEYNKQTSRAKYVSQEEKR
jgi:hypothetical protein